jgi:hypothetical protein
MNNGGCNEVHQSSWHIVAELPAARTRRVPRQPDEAVADEPTTDRNERFGVQVFNVCMDSVIALSERFAEDKIPLRYTDAILCSVETNRLIFCITATAYIKHQNFAVGSPQTTDSPEDFGPPMQNQAWITVLYVQNALELCSRTIT